MEPKRKESFLPKDFTMVKRRPYIKVEKVSPERMKIDSSEKLINKGKIISGVKNEKKISSKLNRTTLSPGFVHANQISLDAESPNPELNLILKKNLGSVLRVQYAGKYFSSHLF